MRKQSRVINNLAGLLALAQEFSSYDWSKPLQVEIKLFKPKRTLPQNALYWAWVTECVEWLDARNYSWANKLDADLMRECGGDVAKAKRLWLHRSHKATFLGFRDIEYTDLTNGEVITKTELIGTSGADFDTGQMHFFMNLVYEYWLNLGLILTIPEECEYRDVLERQRS